MRNIFTTLLILISIHTFALVKVTAQPILNPLCVKAHCPIGKPSNQIVDHKLIILSSNKDTKFADWVAYKVEKANLGGGVRSSWKKDPYIDVVHTLIPNDYIGANNEPYKYDRGHQAPLANFGAHPDHAVVNYLSNITPQKADLNQGAWRRLEDAERNLIKKHNYNDFYVVTGPYYDENAPGMPKLPNVKRNGEDLEHQVPHGYWKILITVNGNSINYAAFALSQMIPKDAIFCDSKYYIDINRINSITGLNVLPNINATDSKDIRKDLGCDELS